MFPAFTRKNLIFAYLTCRLPVIQKKTAGRFQTESIERLLPEVQGISINAVQLVRENNRHEILLFIENNLDLQEFRHRENNDGEKINHYHL
jgi:hypothetical protein